MKIRKFLAILLTLMLVQSDLAVIAEGVATLELPSALKTIEAEAFRGNTSIEKVIVPDGTTRIESRAFADSSLSEIKLPGSLDFIAQDAFDGSNVLSVIAEEDSYAYGWALGKGYAVEAVTPIKYFTTKALPDGTLAITGYTGDKTEIIIPEKIGGKRVAAIGEGAFESTGITGAVIPEGVTSIDSSAFAQTKLTGITIPASVESIGAYAFSGCAGLSAFTLAEGNAAYKVAAGALYSQDGEELIAYPAGSSATHFAVANGTLEILPGAFAGAKYLTGIALSEGLERIGAGAFEDCSGLQQLVIPSSCTDIGSGAFRSCENLKSVEIPESVYTIPVEAFARCELLKSIVLPEGVGEIQSGAFAGCSGLESIVLPESISHIEKDAFADCLILTATVAEGGYAHNWCLENNVSCLPVRKQLRIESQPQDVTAPVGTTAEFTVVATGEGLAYQWQYSDDYGASWNNYSAAKASLAVVVAEEQHGRLVRCIVSDDGGSEVISDSACILAEGMLKIIVQPTDVYSKIGYMPAFAIAAAGTGLHYEWQYSDDEGANWLTADGVDGEIYEFSASEETHGRMVRCIVTDDSGNRVTSDTVRLIISALLGIAIVDQPQDVLCSIGDAVELSVSADGIGLHYMWQYSADGDQWIDLGVTDSTCALSVSEENLGYRYRCRLWDDYGSSCISESAALIDETVLILSQPKDWTGSESGEAYFDVGALDSVVSYQWQISANNGSSWSNSSVVSSNYSTTAAASKDGWIYRCIVTDAEGRQQISDTARLTISDEFAIVSQPEQLVGELEENLILGVQAGGSNVTFEWQRCENDGSWKTLSVGKARINQTVSLATIGKYYRCIITNGDGSTITSKPVQLRWSGSGFFTYNKNQYYVKEDGCLANGLTEVGSDLYCFTATGMMTTGVKTIDGRIYYFTDRGPAAQGFVYVPGEYNIFYFGEDHAAAIGWTEINGNSHYFYETGVMARGVTQIGENEYFFDHETGVRTYGMVQVGLDDYMYFLEGKDQPFAGLKEIDGALYYFCDKEENYGVSLGALQAVGDKTYYFDPRTKQAVKGFVTHNNNVYYMGPDYAMVSDDFASDGRNTYLFNPGGTMRYGLVYHNGYFYYLDPVTGAAARGWMELGGAKLYFDPVSFAAKTGISNIGGEDYYFNAKGYLTTGIVNVDGVRYYFAPEGENETGFVEVNHNKYYVYADKKVATGLTSVNGQLYYFDTSGIMMTGFRMVDGVRYYFDPDAGAAVTGFVQIANGYTYYFNGASGTGSGLMEIDGALYYLDATGIVQYGRISVGGKIYYFDPASGQAQTGWMTIQTSSGLALRAYYDPETYCARTGLTEIGGALYYFDEGGWTRTGKQIIDDVCYYFDPGTCQAYTGWYQDTDGGYYYFDGANGRVVGPGVVQIGDAFYCLNAVGKRMTGMQIIDGARMYFDPVTAQSVDGFVFIADENEANGGKVYYFDQLKDVRYGLQNIDGNTYYFATTGLMRYGLQTVDGVKYYFDDLTGARNEGIIYSKANGNYYLFDSDSASGVATSAATVGGVLYVAYSSGTLRKGYCATATSGLDYRTYLDDETGEQQLGLIEFVNSSGATVAMYFQPQGCLTSVAAVRKELESALASDGWHVVEGITYYVKNGAFLKGKQNIAGKTYYFSNMTGAMLTGLRRIGDQRYYFDQTNGTMQTGLLTIDGKQYYFDPATGAQAFGLTQVGGKTYYFMEGGALTGTVQAGDTRYVFQQSGAGQVVTEPDKKPAPVPPSLSCVWGTIDGTKCYYGMDGKLVTGLKVIDSALYYFDASGRMQKGIRKVNGVSYYFGESGAESGCITIGGKEYYFSPSNFAMLTGMQKIDGALHYYNEDGTRQIGWVTLKTGERFYMTASGTQTGLARIDGNTYYFGENGIMRTGMQQVTTDDNTQITCMFNDDGAMTTGFVSMNGNLYYYDDETGARAYGLVEVDGTQYYFDPATGIAMTGLRNIDGVYCYFDPETAQRKLGIQNVDGKIYCFTDDETGFATGLKVIDGKTYCFYEANGMARSGYYAQDSVKYYFDPITGESVSGIYRRDNGGAYFFLAGGGVDTGWVEVDGKSHFFYPATGLMAEGLASVGDKLYYFDYDNGFLRDTTVVVGGVTYRLDENGYGSAVGSSNIARLINAGIANLDKAYGPAESFDNPSAFSCSELVSYVFNQIGFNVIRRVDRQYFALLNGDLECKVINDIGSAKAGDLIFFTTVNCQYGSSCNFWNELHHVGIYLGDGKILESYAIEDDDYNNGPMIRDLVESSNTLIYKLIRIRGVND